MGRSGVWPGWGFCESKPSLLQLQYCWIIIKGIVQPKVQSIRPSFIFGTQIKIFFMKSESFMTLHRVKAQKGSKDIVKIVHVTSVVQPSFYEATRILFVSKEKKSNDFIQQFLSSVSVSATYSRVMQDPVFWRRRNCWIKSVFTFFFLYSCSFLKLRLNHRCHMDYFNDVLTTFLGLERGSYVAVHAGSESSRISSNITCSEGLTGLERHAGE